jgi:uncharacterized cupin superfamily protein
MPKIDIAAIRPSEGSYYPPPFDAPCAERARRRLGLVGKLRDFGVNLVKLPPGTWSSQRHWHSHEDEFVYVLEGEVALIEDAGETVLRAGDCAAFPKGAPNGHHLINKSSVRAVYLEVGSRNVRDVTTCSDIDLVRPNTGGRILHKDGTPYPKAARAKSSGAASQPQGAAPQPEGAAPERLGAARPPEDTASDPEDAPPTS